MAAEISEETHECLVLKDWEVVRRLNQLAGNPGALRRSCEPPSNRTQVQGALDGALLAIPRKIPTLKTGFRVPAVEALAIIWPGAERQSQSTAPDSADGDPLSESME